LDVFKIFIQPEFPQDFAHSVVGYGGNVGDPFLLILVFIAVITASGFAWSPWLKLGQYLLEVV
jgi:hypothetical protein